MSLCVPLRFRSFAMSLAASRMLLRRPQIGRVAIRHASTTSEVASKTASKAKEVANSATSSASQGLSKVSGAAESSLSKAGSAASSTVNSITGTTGKLIGYVQAMIPPTIYYSRVGLELARLVARGQKMSPPNMASFQSYGQRVMNAARNPLAQGPSDPSQAVSSVLRMDSKQLAVAGVVAAEVIGFFTVGECIGRMKFIGYRSSAPAHH
ncbi:hypothetical protein BT93_L5570 [Corymbia citriodora subsp. variegata]|uniref:Uncharacterized protein n=1 Tax=Corymbia citriodora subsp. variegata TaxID=360336 RepID=A0A8T0CEZ7_CORYI|nr:hypothetical protein BT93_L5570 [Corymbia citriodora subsp. variegata]